MEEEAQKSGEGQSFMPGPNLAAARAGGVLSGDALFASFCDPMTSGSRVTRCVEGSIQSHCTR